MSQHTLTGRQDWLPRAVRTVVSGAPLRYKIGLVCLAVGLVVWVSGRIFSRPYVFRSATAPCLVVVSESATLFKLTLYRYSAIDLSDGHEQELGFHFLSSDAALAATTWDPSGALCVLVGFNHVFRLGLHPPALTRSVTLPGLTTTTRACCSGDTITFAAGGGVYSLAPAGELRTVLKPAGGQAALDDCQGTRVLLAKWTEGKPPRYKAVFTHWVLDTASGAIEQVSCSDAGGGPCGPFALGPRNAEYLCERGGGTTFVDQQGTSRALGRSLLEDRFAIGQDVIYRASGRDIEALDKATLHVVRRFRSARPVHQLFEYSPPSRPVGAAG